MLKHATTFNMQLFYLDHIQPQDTHFYFNEEEHKHLVRVLRKNEGDLVHVTNGKGYMFKAELIEIASKKTKAKVLSVTQAPPRKYNLHLAIAPTKMNDRIEWFLEKATEIGIDRISFILCDHSERKKIKLERYQRVLVSALKQSLHYKLPEVSELVPFSKFIQSAKATHQFIAHCYDEEKILLSQSIKLQEDYLLLIGPEGDFSTAEVQHAVNQGFKPVSLGNSRLRTETAGIVGVHTFALLHE